MSRRSRRPELDELHMELTPMIDIVFNLLVFFMVATKFKSEEWQFLAFLPQNRGPTTSTNAVRIDEARVKLLWVDAAGAPTEADEGFVVVALGARRLNQPGQVAPGAPVWAALHDQLVRLQADYAGDNPHGVPVIIDARPQVPTQVVVSVLNEVRRAELQDVTFAAPESR